MRFYAVHEFECAECNATCLGETQHHIKTRINEHLYTVKKGHVLALIRKRLL